MSGLRPFQRRSFLQGVAGGVAGAVAAGSLAPGVVQAATQDDYNMEATREGLRAVPFHGPNQAGIATAPQTAAGFLAFDVTAANRGELTALFRALTERAAFLTAGGTLPATPPTSAPSDDRLLGPTVLPDDLTVTVGLGASLFDGRYGLGPTKPAQLETMRAFAHDNLDPAICDGDLLVQLCAGHRDTVGHAMLDILAHTAGGMRLRWRIDGFRFPPRPVGIPRDWMGFKDGITNPDTTNTTQMNREVWVQAGPPEPAWTAGGTYQVVRIIRMLLDKWAAVSVAEQERIFGRRKISGAPLYATSPTASAQSKVLLQRRGLGHRHPNRPDRGFRAGRSPTGERGRHPRRRVGLRRQLRIQRRLRHRHPNQSGHPSPPGGSIPGRGGHHT